MGELWRRIVYLFNRRRLEAELEADMEVHREMAARSRGSLDIARHLKLDLLDRKVVARHPCA